MDKNKINIEDKYKYLNEVIDELPNDIMRTIKIKYDAKIISLMFNKSIKNNDENKLVFNELKFYYYDMQDLYYLISRISSSLNYNLTYYPNYKKDGYNIFINQKKLYNLYLEDDIIIIEYIK